MGYWEQIGEENRRHRERLARMHPLQRKIRSVAGYTLLVVATVALWAVMFTPLVQIVRGVF